MKRCMREKQSELIGENVFELQFINSSAPAFEYITPLGLPVEPEV